MAKIDKWRYRDIAIDEVAEAQLAGDRIVNGEFTSHDQSVVVRAFSIKRYSFKADEGGVFSHTPDRCWTVAGWTIASVAPGYVDCPVGGLPIRCERRLFIAGAHQELVYFGAIVGGKPLPYRLDQYLASSLKKTEKTREDAQNAWQRLTSRRVWGWAWDSFVHRICFEGPQHFFRISTTVHGQDLTAADKLLQDFLPLWLQKCEYRREYEAWKIAHAQERK